MRDEALTERQGDRENGVRRSNEWVLFVTHYTVLCIGILLINTMKQNFHENIQCTLIFSLSVLVTTY